LHAASECGDLRSIEALVKVKADVDIQDLEGKTPLHRAIDSEATQCIETLCMNRASLNVPDLEGKTPLQRAIDSKATQCIAALEAAGALYSSSPVHDAAAKGKSSLIESLVSEGANINDHDE
jgi:ankyrin repeat protein